MLKRNWNIYFCNFSSAKKPKQLSICYIFNLENCTITFSLFTSSRRVGWKSKILASQFRCFEIIRKSFQNLCETLSSVSEKSNAVFVLRKFGFSALFRVFQKKNSAELELNNFWTRANQRCIFLRLRSRPSSIWINPNFWKAWINRTPGYHRVVLLLSTVVTTVFHRNYQKYSFCSSVNFPAFSFNISIFFKPLNFSSRTNVYHFIFTQLQNRHLFPTVKKSVCFSLKNTKFRTFLRVTTTSFSFCAKFDSIQTQKTVKPENVQWASKRRKLAARKSFSSLLETRPKLLLDWSMLGPPMGVNLKLYMKNSTMYIPKSKTYNAFVVSASTIIVAYKKKEQNRLSFSRYPVLIDFLIQCCIFAFVGLSTFLGFISKLNFSKLLKLLQNVRVFVTARVKSFLTPFVFCCSYRLWFKAFTTKNKQCFSKTCSWSAMNVSEKL